MQDQPYLEQLVHRLIGLNEGAYQEFAEIFGPLLVRYFVRHGLPYFEAEDLAATCTTDIAVKVCKYRPGGSFNAWVFAIARNTLSDYRKKALRKSGAAEEPPTVPEAETWFDLDLALEVQTALAELSEDDRVLVLGRALGSRSYKELAEELGVTEEAARVAIPASAARPRSTLAADARCSENDRKEPEEPEHSMSEIDIEKTPGWLIDVLAV